MNKETERNEPMVQRITIDERMDEVSFRLMVADLEEGIKTFLIPDIEPWEEEKIDLANREKIQRLFGMVDPARRQHVIHQVTLESPGVNESDLDLFWDNLAEGQVYLVGQFRVESVGNEPKHGVVKPGIWNFLRIDRLESVKQAERELYSAALRAKDNYHGRPSSS